MTGRIGIITPTFARGGNEEYAIALACHVRDRGAHVTVCLPDVDELRSVRRDLAAARIETSAFAASREMGCLNEGFLTVRDDLVHLLRRRAFDAVVLSLPWVEFGAPLLDAAAICDVQTLVVHQLVERSHRAIWSERQAYTWIRRQRQTWVAVSAHNRDRLCESLGWDKDAIEVVPNGVLRQIPDVSAEARAAARASVRAELGLPHDTQLVLTVGRLDHQKAYDVALDAAMPVVQRDRNVHYVWLGDGPLEDDLRREIARRGLDTNVHPLGRRTDVARFLLASDLFVLPSRFEGLPFAALEALQAGLPGVYSNIGPHAEIVHDGVEGLLVPVEDATVLAAAVEQLIAAPSLRASMSHAARERAKAFSADAHFTKILDLLARAGEHPERPNWPLPKDSPRRRIAIYGAGAGGRQALETAMPNDEVVAFLDRDRWRDGEPLCGRPVLEPSAVTTLDIDAVVIASCYHEQMVETLVAAGYPADRIDVFHPVRPVDAGPHDKDDSVVATGLVPTAALAART